MLRYAAFTVLTLALAAPAAAVVTVSVEAAGAQTTSVNLAYGGVETFDAASTGFVASLASTFGGSISGTYDAQFVNAANQYGGAGGVGQFSTVTGVTTLTLTGAATNYFGLWVSAIDGGNAIQFYKGGTLVGNVNLTTFPLGGAYNGNPTAPFLGQNSGEKYAFFNFVVTGGFDQVVLAEGGGGGFENDNHTIGFVPEPESWAMLIAGLGLVGAAMRRRRHAAA